MSQFPPNQPPQGQPPYGQPPQGQQPYGQPQYNQPPQGQQFQQPPQQPGGFQQPPQQQGNFQQPPQQQPQYAPAPKIVQPAQVVNADGFERALVLIPYIWLALFGLSAPLLGFRLIDYGGIRSDFDFQLNLGGVFGLLGAIGVLFAVRENGLAKFHARQALFLGLAYVVLRIVVSLFYLIPVRGVQDILVTGILVQGLQLVIAAAAIFAAVRGFLYREQYKLPVIGAFAGSNNIGNQPLPGALR